MRNKGNGFTLIEIMVSLSVLAVLMSVFIYLNVNHLRNREAVKTTANYIISLFEQNKSTASTRKVWRAVRISQLTSGTYRFSDAEAIAFAPIPASSYNTITVPGEVSSQIKNITITVGLDTVSSSTPKVIIFPPSIEEFVYVDQLAAANELSTLSPPILNISISTSDGYTKKLHILPNGYIERE